MKKDQGFCIIWDQPAKDFVEQFDSPSRLLVPDTGDPVSRRIPLELKSVFECYEVLAPEN